MPGLDFDRTFRIIGLLGAIGSFLWGVFVWRENREKELRAATAEQQRAAESRRVESTKPFLERQLTLYTEATQAASTIATSEDREELRKATARFWRLYWGELAMVEDREVEAAMKALGDALSDSADRGTLAPLSLRLAHACRASLDRSWGIRAWTSGSTREQ
jgi:hypothetical protein